MTCHILAAIVLTFCPASATSGCRLSLLVGCCVRPLLAALASTYNLKMTQQRAGLFSAHSSVLQDIKGSDIFSDDSSGTGHAAGAVPGLSDAKKKALYSTSVFGQDDPAAAPQVNCL